MLFVLHARKSHVANKANAYIVENLIISLQNKHFVVLILQFVRGYFTLVFKNFPFLEEVAASSSRAMLMVESCV